MLTIRELYQQYCDAKIELQQTSASNGSASGQSQKILSMKSIQQHIKNNKVEIDSAQQTIRTIESNITAIERWKLVNQQYKERQERTLELIRLQDEELELKHKLTGIHRLKDIVKKVETTLLLNAIDNINQYVANYLDIFFQTHPISVTITIRDENDEKATKSTKSAGQLTISVNYKGMDADIGILSGGELQRVIVAFNLALAELFTIPMILLDECTSNLDQELTETVVKGIRNNSKGKMIIMIAHQVVQGLFDKVIDI